MTLVNRELRKKFRERSEMSGKAPTEMLEHIMRMYVAGRLRVVSPDKAVPAFDLRKKK